MNQPARDPTTETRTNGADAARTLLDDAMSRYETPLLRYAGQILGRSPEEAEDVVQEAFLRYYRQASSDGGAGVRNVSAWLFKVTRNLVMDAIRRRQRQQVERGELREPPPAPGDALEELMHREACDKVLAELHQLPEAQREVLLLRVMHGMKLREISEVTGLTVGNAGYRIGQGLQELTRRLKADGVI